MQVQEAYLRFITKLNRNYGTDNITADRQRFVLAFNENLVKWVEEVLDNKNDDDLKSIQVLLITNKSLKKSKKYSDRQNFELPIDLLEISSAYSIGNTKKCGDRKIFLWEIKDQNYNEILSDEFNKPSYEFQEAPYIISNNEINVFKQDFEVTETILTYYRYPKYIDIEGYIKPDGSKSKTINPELEDKIVNKVISMTVEDFARNYQDQLGVVLNKDRVVTNT